MNYSESLALAYVEKTRAMMADPGCFQADWPPAVLIVLISLLLFVCLQYTAE